MAACVRCSERRPPGRCDYCLARPVEAPEHLVAPCLRVRAALAARGVVVDQRVHLELRSLDAIRRTVPDATHHLQGLTRYAATRSGELVGRQFITIRAGLPLVDFEACLAHELVHLALVERRTRPPALLDEGMAEYVAYRYLIDDVRARPACAAASRMMRRSGDVYSDGLQIVARTVDQIGFAAAWDALVTGNYRLGERWLAAEAT